MIIRSGLRVALLYGGDRSSPADADVATSRFKDLFEAFVAAGVAAMPAVYHDDFCDEVHAQLLDADAVLVWHNPIEGGRDRTMLDPMLRAVAATGVIVSAHPDTISKIGTKDVLLAVLDLPFGSDVRRIDNVAQLETSLVERLDAGARVLKQRRGQSGIGVWRVERRGLSGFALHHAQRGSTEEHVDLAGVVARLAPYFDNGGYMIDQPWQPRMTEGMTRVYMVRDRVAGFGHQAVVALHPADTAGRAVPTSPRLYSGADDPRFQVLRTHLEGDWLELLMREVDIDRTALPLLWDADFLFGDRVGEGERFVLCEINASSVSPYPETAVEPLVGATVRAIEQNR